MLLKKYTLTQENYKKFCLYTSAILFFYTWISFSFFFKDILLTVLAAASGTSVLCYFICVAILKRVYEKN
jgi:hypothetical protein